MHVDKVKRKFDCIPLIKIFIIMFNFMYKIRASNLRTKYNCMYNFCVKINLKKRFELYIFPFALLWVQKHKEDINA